jgi:hypothetical protein
MKQDLSNLTKLPTVSKGKAQSMTPGLMFGEGAQKSRSQAAPGSTEEGHLKVTLADDEGFENARKLLRDFSLHIADTMADDNRFEQM